MCLKRCLEALFPANATRALRMNSAPPNMRAKRTAAEGPVLSGVRPHSPTPAP